MPFIDPNTIRRAAGAALAILLIAACGSGSNSDTVSDAIESTEQTEFPTIDPSTQVAIDPSQADLLEQLSLEAFALEE
jgi:ABC-type oligopeptide transport system substrate-binding subunit